MGGNECKLKARAENTCPVLHCKECQGKLLKCGLEFNYKKTIDSPLYGDKFANESEIQGKSTPFSAIIYGKFISLYENKGIFIL